MGTQVPHRMQLYTPKAVTYHAGPVDGVVHVVVSATRCAGAAPHATDTGWFPLPGVFPHTHVEIF